MDYVAWGPIITVISFATFIGILLWACSAGAGRGFDEAARLPFEEDGVENGETRR